MPRVGESGAERIDLERMFIGGWAAMVTYRKPNIMEIVPVDASELEQQPRAIW